jgi:hypothetical protein
VENGEGGFNKPSLAMAQDLIHIPCPGLRWMNTPNYKQSQEMSSCVSLREFDQHM